MPPRKVLKLEALKLHFQHPENTFGEIFYVFKTTFHWCIFVNTAFVTNLNHQTAYYVGCILLFAK